MLRGLGRSQTMRSPHLAATTLAWVFLTACVKIQAEQPVTTSSDTEATSTTDGRFNELENQIADLQAQLDDFAYPRATNGVDLQLRECRCWSFDADWLIWRPRRRGLDFAISDPANNEGPIGSIHNVAFDYDNGFRTRVGFNAASG